MIITVELEKGKEIITDDQSFSHEQTLVIKVDHDEQVQRKEIHTSKDSHMLELLRINVSSLVNMCLTIGGVKFNRPNFFTFEVE